MPDPSFRFTPDSLGFAQALSQLLDDLFPTGWFLNAPAFHPAFRRWDLCRRLILQNGFIRLPEQSGDIPLFAELILDAATLVKVSRGDRETFKLGNIQGFGDRAVATKVRSRIGDSDMFGDVMLELTLAAWHMAQGHRVTPLERDGWPDLELGLPGVDRPLYVECKRLTGGGGSTLRKRIQMANRQLKVTGPHSIGAMIIDVSAVIGLVPSDDDPPGSVRSLLEIARQAISGPKNRSVTRIVFTWCGADIKTGSGGTIAFLSRHIAELEHGPAEGFVAPPAVELYAGETIAVVMKRRSTGQGD